MNRAGSQSRPVSASAPRSSSPAAGGVTTVAADRSLVGEPADGELELDLFAGVEQPATPSVRGAQ